MQTLNESMPVFFLLGVLVIGGLLFGILIATRKAPKGLDKIKYQSDWLAIEQSLSAEPGTWQLAVMNADKLLDRALKERGYKGQTMGERMVAAGRIFSKREHVWAAHKLRNRLAHEEVKNMTLRLAKQALSSFKSALKDLGAL
jgi:hypothetical protein